MKVGISLGLTICTNEERRNFARFGFDIADIDTTGDIEEQANESMAAILRVFQIGNEGMEVAVTEALTEVSGMKNTGVRDELNDLETKVSHIMDNLIPNIVGKVRDIDTRIGIGEGN